MDETTTNAVETVEVDGAQQAIDAAFDEDWDDVPGKDDFDLSADEPAEETTDGQPEESEAAGETTDTPESSDGEPEKQEEQKPAEDKKTEEQNQFFTLKVNGEDKLVNLQEMTELAQKGQDYDRIKAERDAFKQDAPTIQRYKGYEAFLEELADNSGITIETLIENTRARLLINAAKEKGEELTEAQAIKQVRLKAKEAAEKAKEAEKQQEQPEPEKAPEETEEQKRNKAFAAFVTEYPNLDPKQIPQEVWSDFAKTTDLVGSYRKYEIKQLRSENEQLKQNQKNKERSTGSRRTAGATTPKDPFDEVWDS